MNGRQFSGKVRSNVGIVTGYSIVSALNTRYIESAGNNVACADGKQENLCASARERTTWRAKVGYFLPGMNLLDKFPFVEARWLLATTHLYISSSSGCAMFSHDAELNAIGLPCPLPVLRVREALEKLEGGQTLYVVATDPDSLKDIRAFARITQNELLEAREEEGKYYFVVRKRCNPN